LRGERRPVLGKTCPGKEVGLRRNGTLTQRIGLSKYSWLIRERRSPDEKETDSDRSPGRKKPFISATNRSGGRAGLWRKRDTFIERGKGQDIGTFGKRKAVLGRRAQAGGGSGSGVTKV